MATARVELNRKALAEVDLALADGLFALAVEVLERTNPPDAPPYGQGLVEGGGAIAYAGKKKVNGTQIGGREIKKPRAYRTEADEVSAIVGYGFPGGLVERGTIHMDAQPFLYPAAVSVMPEAEQIMGPPINRHLQKLTPPGAR